MESTIPQKEDDISTRTATFYRFLLYTNLILAFPSLLISTFTLIPFIETYNVYLDIEREFIIDILIALAGTFPVVLMASAFAMHVFIDRYPSIKWLRIFSFIPLAQVAIIIITMFFISNGR